MIEREAAQTSGPRPDPRGPVFVSYTHDGGAEIARRLKRRLWAAGVPVWHDVDDLLMGNVGAAIVEAMDEGISGIVFVLTEGANRSGWMSFELMQVEAFARDRDFLAAVANATSQQPGSDEPDPTAYDRILGPTAHSYAAHLRLPCRTDDHERALVRRFARRRIDVLRRQRPANTTLCIDVQSRKAFSAFGGTAELTIRVDPDLHPGEPVHACFPLEALRGFAHGLSTLPDLIERAQASAVRISGGLHPSLAVPLGNMLNRRLFGPPRVEFEVVDQFGVAWPDLAPAQIEARRPLPEIVCEAFPEVETTRAAERVLLVVDLNDQALRPGPVRERAAEGYRDIWWIRLAERQPLDPASAVFTIAAVQERIRSLGVRSADLVFVGPFPAAVLLGRWLNTVQLTLLELAGGTSYTPALVTDAGRARVDVAGVQA